jgi:hypothetical protein
MVAIAVVGGILIFVFAQGFFGETQVQAPSVESVTLLGYDMRQLDVAEDDFIESNTGEALDDLGDDDVTDNAKSKDEEGTLFIKNTGNQDLIVEKLFVNGVELRANLGPDNATSDMSPCNYQIWAGAIGGDDDVIRDINVLKPGAETTIIASFCDENQVKIGRAFMVKLETANGASFQFQVTAGIKKGGAETVDDL